MSEVKSQEKQTSADQDYRPRSIEDDRISAPSIKPKYDRDVDIKPTNRRYLILILFCLHSMINAAQWIYLATITSTVADYYQVDNIAINWTSMVYMVVYIPLIVPASWLFERIGMRNSILAGSIGTFLGSALKCFSCRPTRFDILMAGQTIVAICQLFVLNVPPRLASVWFPDHQVSLATACGVFGNQLGIAIGFVIPQMIMGEKSGSPEEVEKGLSTLFLSVTVASGVVSLLIVFLFDQAPSKAPGMARLQQIKQEQTTTSECGTAPLVDHRIGGHVFVNLLQDLFTERNFVLLMVGYGLNVGIFYAISTVLNQMVTSNKWPNPNTLVGRLGLVMVISGMFGSIISGYILDKTKLFRLINTGLYSLSFLSILVFTLVLETYNTIALYSSVALLGCSMTGYLFIGYEMSNEITWPRPESVTAGLLNLSAQVFGIILTYLGSSIVDTRGNLTANMFFAISVFIGLIVTTRIKAQLKRQNAVDI